jgi:hyperosmotically inducible protein
MKTKLVITSLIAGTLLPIAGYAIDRDSNRSQPYPVLMQAIDPALTTQVKFKIASKVSYKTNIDIDTKDGVVFLSGNARNQSEVALAESIARGVKGVTSVQNTIQITPTTNVSNLR